MAVRLRSLGIVGLGQMGRRMAVNLHAAFPEYHFLVADSSQDAIATFVRTARDPTRIRVVSSPSELLSNAAIVLSVLPSTPHVRTVYLGADGFLQALHTLPLEQRSSSVLIDATTLAVDAAREVASQISATGAMMVDAPVSGGVSGAEAATLSFLVGGTSEAFTTVSPYLRAMGSRIIHCGPSGAGLAAKICNNLVLGIHQIATAEAMLLGQALQLDPRILAAVINSSTGGSWSSSVNNPVPGALEPPKSPPCERDFAGGFATALMLKDMGLATDIATKSSSPVPLGRMAEGLYKEAIEAEPKLAGKDFSSIYNYLKGHVN